MAIEFSKRPANRSITKTEATTSVLTSSNLLLVRYYQANRAHLFLKMLRKFLFLVVSQREMQLLCKRRHKIAISAFLFVQTAWSICGRAKKISISLFYYVVGFVY